MSVWGWLLEFGPFAIGSLTILLIAISVRVLGFVVGRITNTGWRRMPGNIFVKAVAVRSAFTASIQ
jgi:hypothetical protein